MRMYNHDYGVINDSLRKALRHVEQCTCVFESDRDAIEEVIQLAEGVLFHLTKLEFIEDDTE
jgi:hypothetical protein